MMIKQQSCFYCNILLYQPLCSTSLTETNDTRFWRSFPTPPANGLFALIFHLEIVKIRRKYDTLNNNHLALSEHL